PQLVALIILHGNDISHLQKIFVLLSVFFEGRFRDDHLSALIVIPISIFKIYKHLKGLSSFFPTNGLFQCRKGISRTKEKVKRIFLSDCLFPLFPVLPIIYMQFISY